MYYVTEDRSGSIIVNSHRPTRHNSTVELCRVGRCELAIMAIDLETVGGLQYAELMGDPQCAVVVDCLDS